MPKLLKRALLLLAALAMLAVSLYGCSTGDTQPTPPAGVSDSGSEASAAQSGELPKGNSVTVGIAQDLDDLDPQLAKTAGIREVFVQHLRGTGEGQPRRFPHRGRRQ